MSEKYFPFPSISGDRKYGVDDWVGYFSPLITNGVYKGGMAVTANGLTVTVGTGSAVINGYKYDNTATLTFTLGAASQSFARIDRIIIRWDKVNRVINTMVLAGTAASSPVGAALTRTSTVYDICIAEVTVAAKSASVTVKDTREDKDLCGVVSLLVQLDADAITPALIGAETAKLTFKDAIVATTAWAGDTTYSSYPYRAAVPLTGVTADMIGDVVFAPDDAASGEMAGVCQTYDGGVYIYSASAPTVSKTIPLIMVWEG